MPVGIYLDDMTQAQWAQEVGRNTEALLRALAETNELKLAWDGFKGSLTDAQVAIKWGRTKGSGTAQAGTTTSVTLKAGDTEPDDAYNGLTIRCTEGTGAGQEATITDYVKSTKVATVASWPTATPDSTTVYAIVDPVAADTDGAIINLNKIRRIALGQIAHTPASALLDEGRKFAP